MNQQIDREKVKEELRVIFHKYKLIFKPSFAEELIKLIEEKTDESYMIGVQDIIKHLKEEYDIVLIQEDENEIALLGNINENFMKDID